MSSKTLEATTGLQDLLRDLIHGLSHPGTMMTEGDLQTRVSTVINATVAAAVEEAMQHMHPGTKQPAEPLEEE